MTTAPGTPTPSRRPGVRSFDELMDRQAEAALALSGADHSSWRRGQLGPTRNVDRGIVLGTADWDGTLKPLAGGRELLPLAWRDIQIYYLIG